MDISALHRHSAREFSNRNNGDDEIVVLAKINLEKEFFRKGSVCGAAAAHVEHI